MKNADKKIDKSKSEMRFENLHKLIELRYTRFMKDTENQFFYSKIVRRMVEYSLIDIEAAASENTIGEDDVRFQQGGRQMKKREIVVEDISQKHSSPVPELVDTACKFKSRILISRDNMQANVKSMMGMAVFNLTKGMEVEITAEGGDEEAAIDTIEKFLTCK